MKKRFMDNIKLVGLVVVLLGVFSTGLWKVWAVESKVEGAVVEVATVGNEVRKLKLQGRRWEIQARIVILEQQMRSTDNDYFPRKIKELEKERDCLEDAIDIKDKHPVDCRP